MPKRLSTPLKSRLTSVYKPPYLIYLISLLVNADIDEIIHRGEERTAEINSKYAGLNIDDLNNFKSDFSVKEWEGEEFGVKVTILFSIFENINDSIHFQNKNLGFGWLQPSKRERKGNYSIDGYYKEAMRIGPKTEKAPKQPRPPKQVMMLVHF